MSEEICTIDCTLHKSRHDEFRACSEYIARTDFTNKTFLLGNNYSKQDAYGSCKVVQLTAILSGKRL